MKNFNKVLLLLAISLLVFPILVSASEFRAGKQTSLTSGEKAADNLYMAGGSVVSAESAGKDLLVAGGTALVSGQVAGDLFLVGGNITVLGQVGGDVRIGGGNIIINGNILGDAVVGGGQIILSSKTVGGDVAIAGGTVRIDSDVKGSVKIAGGEIYINGPVGGDADIRAGKLTLGPNADIKGNLKYSAPIAVTIETGGKVQGVTTFTELKGSGAKNNVGILGFITFLFIAKFLMMLTASLLIGLVFKRYSKVLVENATANPLKEFGLGIATIILLPILSIILLITVIGFPLGIIGLLSFVMLLVYACIITPIFLGALVYKWITRKSDYVINLKTIVLGTVVSSLLGLIPLLGWLAMCVSVMITLGAALNIKSQVIKDWR